MRLTRPGAVGGLLVALGLVAWASVAGAETLTIAAANSTCVAIRNVGMLFSRHHTVDMHYICKSSGRLAKGLKGGSIDADYYISANKAWMDRAVDAGLVAAPTVRSYWGNILVVAAPATNPIRLETFADLVRPEVKQVLIGDPGTAPFGRYAKQAMEAAGVWAEVRGKIATRKHITLLAETLAEAGEGTVGILFATNLQETLKTLLPVPEGLHDPVRYFSAPLIGKEPRPIVADFIDFLESGEGQGPFREQGFQILP